MKTVSGLFDNYDDAVSAVRAIEAAGVPRDDISIIANNTGEWYREETSGAATGAETGAGIGAVAGGAGGLLAGLGLMAVPGVGPVVAAGWLVSTLAGAAAGAVVGGAAGGLIGALTDAGVPEQDAHVYAEGIRRGGTLVTARVDEGLQGTAEAILQRARRIDIETRRNDYTAQGWSRFDEASPPLTAREAELERERYAAQVRRSG